ncbi:hypothetical protein TSUD_266220 [Trifolium subterraneum]|uniref:MSP domain-containing protein n=1 Tax=Trifolium subterraneum TaxID=3900 RepID=A0A2Z6MQ33_TRISU|nr:hypothetical protein TSUD_266220 [Trifolium subterraneum]
MGQKLSADSNGDYERLNNQEDNSYQQILQFPFELDTEISGYLKLSNKSDDYLAFKLQLKPRRRPLLDTQCKDMIRVKIIVLSKNGATIKDVTPTMFHKDSGYEVKEYNWKVVYVAPPQPPSSVREGSDKDLKAPNEQVEQQDTSFQVTYVPSCKFCLNSRQFTECIFYTFIAY